MASEESTLAHAQALIVGGHLRAAAYLIERATEAGNPSLTALAAGCLLDANDPEAAADLLARGAAADGWDGGTRYLLAVALQRLGRFEAAAEQAAAAALAPARRAEALVLMAELRLGLGQLEEARAAAEAALRERSVDIPARLVLARTAEAAGDSSERLKVLEEAASLAPRDTAVRTALGTAYLDAGRYSDGQRQLARVLARNPSHWGAAAALLRPSIQSPQRRRRVVRALRIAPLAIASGATLIGWRAGAYVPSVAFYAYAFALGSVFFGIRLFERRRSDPAVARIKAQTARLARKRSKPTIAGWAPWSLIGIGVLSIAGSIPAIVLEPTRRVRLALLPTLLFGVVLTFLGARLVPRIRKRPRGPRLDDGSCHCHEAARITGASAAAYAGGHLEADVALTHDGIERRRCPLLGYQWVLFPIGAGPSGEILPLLLKLPEGLPPAETTEERRAGFYL